MKKLLPVLVILLFLPICSATITEDVEKIQGKVKSFLDSYDNIIFVEGSSISAVEKTSLVYMKDNYPEVNQYPYKSEKEISLTDLTGKSVILIGGPTQNKLSKQLINDPSFTVERDDTTLGSVIFLSSESSKFLIFTDKAGFGNIPNTAVSKSPLSKIMPEKYVPLAATLIGFTLIWLWSFFAKLFAKIFRFILASKILSKINKKTIKDKFVGFSIFGLRVKLREWLAIIIAAAVFAVSLGYMYLASDTSAFIFLLMTVLVNFIIYSIRHLTRLALDKHHDLHTEYHVWYWGALVTAITAYLGNAFALAGYIVSKDDKGTKHEGRIGFIVNIVTFFAFVVLWIWNFINPGVMLQMAMLLSLAITYLQFLPMNPFVGKKIYKWRKGVWYLCFIPMTVIYILVNLFI